jgi:putative DNA modification/repair radical SAM protein
MDVLRKIEILGESAKYDICASYGKKARRTKNSLERWIYPAVLPNGKSILLLKVLMSNACKNNCFYCPNRYNRDFRRLSFKPDELAKLFLELYRRRFAHGLFLSSAISGGTTATMERMLKTVEILRLKYHFPGYIHLKILPGASFSYVERAVELASRVSINLEAPNKKRLQKIADEKRFEDDLLLRMQWVKSLTLKKNYLPAGQSTQFVVGAAGESDQEILQMTDFLYREMNLNRVYFSAFQPVKDTPLEEHPPTPLLREHRLYQVDFLLRYYGFQLEEIIFDQQGNLPLRFDPKMSWALKHWEKFPIEINTASRRELLRVPGIGPKSATAIIKQRLKNKFYNIEELKRNGVIVKRAAPFILINGKPQGSLDNSIQLSLWNTGI